MLQQSLKIVTQTKSILKAHLQRPLLQTLMDLNGHIQKRHLKSFLVVVLETQELVQVVYQLPPQPSISSNQLLLGLMSRLTRH